MISAIVQEISLRKAYMGNMPLDSIYIGGGTPSLLTESDLILIFSAIEKNFVISQGAEITLETNPDDVNLEWLKVILAVGINRLSIGVQSFQQSCLHYMHRCHSVEESYRAIGMSQDAGIGNISIDLIFGTPTLTTLLWEENLAIANKLGIPHLSCYALTIEPRTALAHRIAKHKTAEPDEEHYVEQFLITHDYLTGNGYIHYEISNYAKDGYTAIHNSNYWQQKPYIGIGPSAHSYNGHSRTWNIANNAKYIQNIMIDNGNYYDTEYLSADTMYNEFIMVSLRTNNGVSFVELEEKYGIDHAHYFMKQVIPYEREGLIQNNSDIFTLTPKGMLYADYIASQCFMA